MLPKHSKIFGAIVVVIVLLFPHHQVNGISSYSKSVWFFLRTLLILSWFPLPKYGCIHFTSLTYTCHWHEYSITSFMPAVQLLRLHCLVTTACIMTQITLPRCYHTTHYLTTQTCFHVYKDPIPEEKSLKLVLLYLQAEYSCASQSPCLSATGVLLDLASEQLHWWSCPVGPVFISCRWSTLCLRSSLSLQELKE